MRLFSGNDGVGYSRYNLVTLASVKTWGIGRELAV